MVRFENVGLRYGLGTEVLRDITFRIDPHSFQFLTGLVPMNLDPTEMDLRGWETDVERRQR